MAKAPTRPSQPAAPPHALVQASKFLQEGKAQAAKPLLMQHVAKHPGDLSGLTMLRVALSQIGEHEQALYYAQKALAVAPDHPDVRSILGVALADVGRLGEAEAAFKRAIEIAPNHQQSMTSLAQLYTAQGRHEEAGQMASRGLALGMNPVLARSMAVAMVHLGQPDQAVGILKRVLVDIPGDPMLLSLLCDTMLHAPSVSPQDASAAHFAFGRLLQQQANMRAELPPRDMNPDRPLRVGLIGSGFRDGALAPFLRPIVRHLDRAAYPLFLYQHGPEDAATAWFASQPGVRYANIARFQPVNICQRVAADQIDVLIDTTGHHSPAVLMGMHLRPAIVHASWLGYPFSTGVAAIDYRIVTAETDPEGTERLGVEKLWRMDGPAACFEAPDASELPMVKPVDTGAPVTFACVGPGPRLNDATLRMWVAAVRRAGGGDSKLIIADASLGHDAARESLKQRVLAAGFVESRLELVALTAAGGLRERLQLIARADIALDTAPVPSPSAIAEAALMGVPTVSVVGRASVQRAALPALKAAGLEEFIAPDADAFVDRVATLAADRPKLAGLRVALRDRLLASSFCDGPVFARRFEAAIRAMWRERAIAAKG